MHFEDGNDHTSYEYDMINIMLTMPMITALMNMMNIMLTMSTTTAPTAATRRTSLSLRTGPHQGNRCHRHRPSRLMIIIMMLAMEMLIIITIIMTWQSLPPSLPFQVDGLI